MISSTFYKLWRNAFGDTAPIGYQLKDIFTERWLRVHSLPESKRYANSKEEYAIMMNRQNEIIGTILGNDDPIIFLTRSYDATNKLHDQVTTWIPIKSKGIIDNESKCQFYLAVISWELDKYNHMLRTVADGETNLLLISFPKHRIIHLYDGGIDIILENSTMVPYFKNKYKNWLSNHPNGL